MSDQRLIVPRREMRGPADLSNNLKREIRAIRNQHTKHNSEISTMKKDIISLLNNQSTGGVSGSGTLFAARPEDGIYITTQNTPLAHTAANLDNPRILYILPPNGRWRRDSNLVHADFSYRDENGELSGNVNNALNDGAIDIMYVRAYLARVRVDTSGGVHYDTSWAEDRRSYLVSTPVWVNPKQPAVLATGSEVNPVGSRFYFKIVMSFTDTNNLNFGIGNTLVDRTIAVDIKYNTSTEANEFGIACESSALSYFFVYGASRGESAWFLAIREIDVEWVKF